MCSYSLKKIVISISGNALWNLLIKFLLAFFCPYSTFSYRDVDIPSSSAIFCVEKLSIFLTSFSSCIRQPSLTILNLLHISCIVNTKIKNKIKSLNFYIFIVNIHVTWYTLTKGSALMFGNRLKKLRKEKKISQQELALKLGNLIYSYVIRM